MSQLLVDDIVNKDDTGPVDFTKGVNATGIVTARGGIEFGASGIGGTITAAGAARFKGIISADAGIDFSGAQTNAAGMTSELLDGYEEGTWTPTLTSQGGTITSATTTNPSYTKIGNIVRFQLRIDIVDAGSGTGWLKVTLPFAPTNDSWAASGSETATVGYACEVIGTSTLLYIRKYDYTTVILDGHVLRIAGTYEI